MSDRDKAIGTAAGGKAVSPQESSVEKEERIARQQFESAKEPSLTRALAAARLLLTKGKLRVLHSKESQKQIDDLLEMHSKAK